MGVELSSRAFTRISRVPLRLVSGVLKNLVGVYCEACKTCSQGAYVPLYI
jgi:hypothetical protein